jgi:hypothetical protein
MRPDVAAAAARLGPRFRDAGGLARQTASLPQGEEVAYVAQASYRNARGLALVTDARVLFFYDGVVEPGLAIPLQAITSVRASAGLATGQVELDVVGESKAISIARVVKADVEPLARVIRDAVESAPPTDPAPAQRGAVDPFEALEKLARLRDDGVITDAEFAAKKQELLDRL